MKANVLIACEYSGIVSRAFARDGFNVFSCDLLPSAALVPGCLHIQGNLIPLLSMQWDLVIAFPPCTWLAKCQLFRKSDSDLWHRIEAYHFVRRIYNANAKHIAIENPIGFLNSYWRPPDQIISPHYFGSPYSKDICLWLKNLPPLIYGAQSPGKKKVSNHVNSRMSQVEKSHIKSKFFPEVAEAMFTQWSPLVRPQL